MGPAVGEVATATVAVLHAPRVAPRRETARSRAPMAVAPEAAGVVSGQEAALGKDPAFVIPESVKE